MVGQSRPANCSRPSRARHFLARPLIADKRWTGNHALHVFEMLALELNGISVKDHGIAQCTSTQHATPDVEHYFLHAGLSRRDSRLAGPVQCLVFDSWLAEDSAALPTEPQRSQWGSRDRARLVFHAGAVSEMLHQTRMEWSWQVGLWNQQLTSTHGMLIAATIVI